MKQNEKIWISLAIAVIAAAGLWWLLSGEYAEEQVIWPENPRLRTETFHMAQRWLELQGLGTSSLSHLQDLDQLPASRGLLILHDDLGRQTDLEARQLLDWLERGGQVLASAPGSTAGADPLNPYRIRRCQACGRDADLARSALLVDEVEDDADFDETGEHDGLFWWQSGDGRRLALRARASLSAETWSGSAEQFRGEDSSILFVRYPVLSGRITLVPETRWMDNWRLLDADHAAILLTLVDEDIEQVWLQQRVARGGLLSWLWRQAPLLWSLLALWTAFWIWSRLVRFGPVQEPERSRHVQIREQLLASARFDWRHNQGRKLLTALREAHGQRLLQHFPDWRQRSREQRLDGLTALCPGAARERWNWFLDIGQLTRADDLRDFVALHEQLMHAL